MSGLRRISFVVLAVWSVLVVSAWAQAQSRAQAQAPASVPPSLQALEQKMAQIRFNTA
jgi:hypothetical protein